MHTRKFQVKREGSQRMKKPWKVYDSPLTKVMRDRVLAQNAELFDLDVTDEHETRIAQGFTFWDEDVDGILWDLGEEFFDGALDIHFDSMVEGIQFIRYSAGGRYDWHLDADFDEMRNRKLTVVMAFNHWGEYHGGGIDIMWPTPDAVNHIDLDFGQAVVFPSILFHRGVEITAGTRDIVVAWFTDGVGGWG